MERKDGLLRGGTGARLGHAAIIVAGVFALTAVVLTIVSIWLQLKNYRKPLLQRYVIRILFMVPFFSAASWASLVSLNVSFWISPFRDVYEAFVIYAFFQLLINFIGGERALIILMHGRPPVAHPWPISHFLEKVDISDPHTFLAIKRGILQYTWIKPALSIATIIMKATKTYQEGYIGWGSGYFWSSLIYNISITISLYALAMFWICMSDDLTPFRPMPKFLCIKGIIFASYWQGFMLSILVWLGAIPDSVPGYTPDNLAASIQDALICFEMPLFAIAHWYAFSWKDYADVTISAARMPVKYALRDACGVVDLIQDAKETFRGTKYEYRYFDADDNTLAHEESRQRVARMMEGMRYERGGRGKYWIPKSGQVDSKTPLLGANNSSNHPDDPTSSKYGATFTGEIEDPTLNEDDENLFANARALEFGDWNYPVITAHHATREDRLYRDPNIVTASSSRHVLQPTKGNELRRKSQIQHIQDSMDNGKHRQSSSTNGGRRSHGLLPNKLQRSTSQHSKNGNTKEDQLVDLVVEDERAEQVEQARARKEGSSKWNRYESKHFVRAFPEDDQEEEVREGFEPSAQFNKQSNQQHAVDTSVEDDLTHPVSDVIEPEEAEQWEERDYSRSTELSHDYDADAQDTNVWNSPKR